MKNTSLRLGLQTIDGAVGPNPDSNTAIVAAKCRALLHGYNNKWQGENYEPVAVNRFITATLYNPDTNRSSRQFYIGGEEDLICTSCGKRVLFDHKTTSQDISEPNAPYWRQLAVESQVNHYMLLEWLNGEKCDGAVWDVVRKPTIAPKKLAKAEIAHAVGNQSYMNCRLNKATLATLQVEARETPEMYEARLTKDCSVTRPDWYFQRCSVPRMDCELLEYARELWGIGQEMLRSRKNDRHPRHSGACMLYGSPCVFLGLCSGHDTSDSDRWLRKANVHGELPDLDGDGRNLITNSRIRCFQTCQRKHYYSYELGIERSEPERREALYFGNIWHRALAAWWTAKMKGEKCLQPDE